MLYLSLGRGRVDQELRPKHTEELSWQKAPFSLSDDDCLSSEKCFDHSLQKGSAMPFHAINGLEFLNLKVTSLRYRGHFSPAFHQEGTRNLFISMEAFIFAISRLPLVVFGPILQSERRGRLDFGGEDLPEPPLQLLHVGRFGSGQVEASSSFLPVPSSQHPDHLQHRGHGDLRKWFVRP